MSPAGARRGFKQWWTLTKHAVQFGSAREARDIIFLAAEPGKAAGSLHNVPAARHPEPRELPFPKNPGNPKQLLGQTEPCKMLHPACRMILGRDLGSELTEMRGKAVAIPCVGIFTRRLGFYKKLCKGKLLGSDVCPALPKQLYLFLDGVRPAAWQNMMLW